ncbi:ADP-dependent glucokinase-like [Amphiura filiformis]|uniref:ADP-dependent glucokinase-like n=1 Tax=Amphiura filiformis TaxID=82378 RepID=UPI003B20B96A
MITSAFKYGGLLSMIIILVAYVYKRNLDDQLRQRLDDVLQSLLRAERKVSVTPRTRVALGLGSCMDLSVNATELFARISLDPPAEPKHHGAIQGAAELAECFAYQFTHGAAAERYIHDQEFYKQLVAVSSEIPTAAWAIGGNALVMANRLAMEGCDVLLGGSVTPRLKEMLHDHVKVLGIRDFDEVHMALEYKTGERWGKYEAPRANRLLINSDLLNPKLEGLKEFGDKLKEFKPNAVVIGGLQMMDNYPRFKEGEREQLLTSLQDLLKELPENMKIHFEMASFTEEAMMKELLNKILYYSDSIGGNEQELDNIYSLLNYGNITILSDPYPRVAKVLDQMRSVYEILRKTTRNGNKRPLTRMHIHTVAFQAILSQKGSPWKNTMASAAKASLVANRHVCGKPRVDTEKARLIMDDSFSISREEGSRRVTFSPERPVSCWEESDYEICVAPVVVCTEVLRTAGGGDNISAAGLVLQI